MAEPERDDLWETHADWWISGFTDGADPEYEEQILPLAAAELAGYDLFLTPTLALPPQPHAWFTESGDPAEDHRRELLFTPYTALMNMSGQPAMSLPLYEHDGLPASTWHAHEHAHGPVRHSHHHHPDLHHRHAHR